MTTEAKTKWAIEADYYQTCNCDYGCPCEFEAPPTTGFCDGIGAYKIKKGNHGDVSLDGLGFAFALHSPKAIHEGNLTVVLIFDERADEAQRESLLKITTGQEGGMPFEIIVQLVGKLIDPIYAPFEFNNAGQNSTVKIGDIVSMAFEPIKNPVTGEPESMRIEHETGFIFKGADVVSAKEGKISIDGLDFSNPDKSGFVTTVNYSN
ncbi:MAG: DUF1326 domain-containing protein [Chloroflexi bacterium]|nr:DUF1326 domain-containing protein [Chloroflexota bacterium]